MKKRSCFSIMLCCITLFLSSCQSSRQAALVFPEPDLIIYTVQDEEIYASVIKEFSQRTGMSVRVETGTSEELIAHMDDEENLKDCDVLFGVDIETLEEYKDLWQPYESPEADHIFDSFQSADHSWTTFSTLPLVIMYNTNVVTYRELPTGWSSLLEPRWKGRIAFVNPAVSDIYASALVTAIRTCPSVPDYLEQLFDNLEYETLEQISDVNTGIATGRYSLGITLEESAQILLNEGADIEYIYPIEGTIAVSEGSAIRKNCAHPDAAKLFLDFTISKDTQRILVSSLNRRTVRDDILPPSGLPPIQQIPLLEYDLTSIHAERIHIREQWMALEGGIRP